MHQYPDMIDGYLIIAQFDIALKRVDTVIQHADDFGIILYVGIVDLVVGILKNIIRNNRLRYGYDGAERGFAGRLRRRANGEDRYAYAKQER